MKESEPLNVVSLVPLGEYLADLCSRKQNRNYFHLLDLEGLVPIGPWENIELLDHMLKAIHDLDFMYGRPSRTVASVCEAGDKLSTDGYYRQLKVRPNADKKAAYERVRVLAHAHYRSEVLREASYIDAILVFDEYDQFVAERNPRRRPPAPPLMDIGQ